MLSVTPNVSSFSAVLANEAATRALAVEIAGIVQPSDVITLSGDLGAGKTHFARALIRHVADNDALEVPSPTFTLVQSYALPRFTIVHADLYRVSDASELGELGIEGEGAVVLMEWPDRAADQLSADRIDIELMLLPGLGPNFRHADITGRGSLAPRVERLGNVRRFLAEAGYGEAQRTYMQGDASTRTYERVTLGTQRAILMNAPRQPDGPPVRGSLPYSAIAHLAEDVKPFVAMTNALRGRGLSAPEIYAADLAQGLLLLEDLGSQGVITGEPPEPIEERYAAAVDVLSALHKQTLPGTLPVVPDVDHRLPSYDIDALLIEAELVVDWYVPHRGSSVGAAARAEFDALWRQALAPALEITPTWVLRDFHSPNLLWLPEREGAARIGLLDFQDALMGPAGYDVASLLQDARVDVPEEMEITLLGRYVKARMDAEPAFDPRYFVERYVALGAQRATKILGIFARLDRRDGKPQYLRHLPRIWRYLNRSLRHPALGALRHWYEMNVPSP